MRQTAPGSDRRQTEVLALLVENARQFLQKALGELPDDPKSSVIDFYSGVELILKARLLHEHWTLIVARDPHRNRFHSGDFTSVTFDEACRRIDAVLSCPLPDAAFRAFDKIRKHRNRMVHFYDADLVSSSGRLRGVALAQLQAWYQLNKLMRADWQDVFAPMRDRFAGIERVLHRHRGYAAAKYHDLKAQIEALRRKGHAFGRCGRCAQPAAQAYPIERGLRQLRCQVCDESWPEMDIQCPSCVRADGRSRRRACVQSLRLVRGLRPTLCHHGGRRGTERTDPGGADTSPLRSLLRLRNDLFFRGRLPLCALPDLYRFTDMLRLVRGLSQRRWAGLGRLHAMRRCGGVSRGRMRALDAMELLPAP